MVVPQTCSHIEVRTQTGILLQPVLVIGLYPVYLAILEREIGNSTEDLVVIFQVIHLVILCKAAAKGRIQSLIRGVGNTKHIGTAVSEVLTEMPIIAREMRGNKYNVHDCNIYL